MYRVLLVDDKKTTVSYLSHMLKDMGYAVVPAFGGEEAYNLFKTESVDIVVSDICMEPVGGVELLRMIHKDKPDTPVIMITGHENILSAGESVRAGAFDYVRKPFDVHDLVLTIRRGLAYSQAQTGAVDVGLLAGSYYCFGDIVAQSDAMHEVCEAIRKVGPTDAAVLIRGEEGTGRLIVARTIHDVSLFASKPFHSVDCAEWRADQSRQDIKAGIEDGAVGTLFFRDLDLLPAAEQRLIRRDLEQTARDLDARGRRDMIPRLCASTSPDPSDCSIVIGEDLTAQLPVVHMALTPLRKRKEDILPIVHHILRSESGGTLSLPRVDLDMLLILGRYDWPGNVGELENAIRHAQSTGPADRLTKEALPSHIIAEGGEITAAQKLNLRNEFLLGQGLSKFVSETAKTEVQRLIQFVRSSKADAAKAAARRRGHDSITPVAGGSASAHSDRGMVDG